MKRAFLAATNLLPPYINSFMYTLINKELRHKVYWSRTISTNTSLFDLSVSHNTGRQQQHFKQSKSLRTFILRVHRKSGSYQRSYTDLLKRRKYHWSNL